MYWSDGEIGGIELEEKRRLCISDEGGSSVQSKGEMDELRNNRTSGFNTYDAYFSETKANIIL